MLRDEIRDVSGIVANGGVVCSINLDAPFASGVGIIRHRDEHEKYGIQVGTPVFALCSDLGRRLCNNGYDWTCSTIERTGRIVDLEARIPTPDQGIFQRAIVVDFPSVDGNSGGPVFAHGKVNDVEYPILIGVISGRLVANSEGRVAVAPIGHLVNEIERILKSGRGGL